MAEIKLAPCPVCGEVVGIHHADMLYWVQCDGHPGECWKGPESRSPKIAALAWNGVCGLWALGPEIMSVLKAVIGGGFIAHYETSKLVSKLEALGIKE